VLNCGYKDRYGNSYSFPGLLRCPSRRKPHFEENVVVTMTGAVTNLLRKGPAQTKSIWFYRNLSKAVSFSFGYVEVYIEESLILEEHNSFLMFLYVVFEDDRHCRSSKLKRSLALSLYFSPFGSRSVCLHAWVSLACPDMCSIGFGDWEDLPDAIPFL
jgi:hypothetical protein